MKVFSITGTAIIYPKQKTRIEKTKLDLRIEAIDALNSGIKSLLEDNSMSESQIEIINIETVDETMETIGPDVRFGSVILCAYIKIPNYAYEIIMKEGKIYDISNIL